MKFQQLQVGQRFEFEGKVYVKTGPVAAAEEGAGKQRMVPRYAVLKPVGEAPAASLKKAPKMLSKELILSLFDGFYAECTDILVRSPNPEAKARLEAARQRFLESL